MTGIIIRDHNFRSHSTQVYATIRIAHDGHRMKEVEAVLSARGGLGLGLGLGVSARWP